MRAELVELYQKSHLGNFQVSTRVPRVWDNDPWKPVINAVSRALHCFNPSNVLSVDFVLRANPTTVCAPHLPAVLADPAPDLSTTHLSEVADLLKRLYNTPGAKWSILKKCAYSNSLGVLLAYAAVQCQQMSTLLFENTNLSNKHGFLIALPLSVDDNRHKNMLLLRPRVVNSDPAQAMTTTSIEVHLFEPNGRSAAEAILAGRYHSNLDLVRRAAVVASGLLQIATDGAIQMSDVQLASITSVGIQTILGEHTTQGLEGYPICAAISYWVLQQWLQQQQIVHNNYHDAMPTTTFETFETFETFVTGLVHRLHWSSAQWKKKYKQWNHEIQKLNSKMKHDRTKLTQAIRIVEQEYKATLTKVEKQYKLRYITYKTYSTQYDVASRKYRRLHAQAGHNANKQYQNYQSNFKAIQQRQRRDEYKIRAQHTTERRACLRNIRNFLTSVVERVRQDGKKLLRQSMVRMLQNTIKDITKSNLKSNKHIFNNDNNNNNNNNNKDDNNNITITTINNNRVVDFELACWIQGQRQDFQVQLTCLQTGIFNISVKG